MDSINHEYDEQGWTQVCYKKKRDKKKKPSTNKVITSVKDINKENEEDILDFPEPFHYKSKCISFGTF